MASVIYKCDGLACGDKARCYQFMRTAQHGDEVVWETPKVVGEMCPNFKRYTPLTEAQP